MLQSFISLALTLISMSMGSITVQNNIDCQRPGLYGYYNFVDNNLVVCEFAYERGEGELTAAHELVHMAQDSYDGIKNNTIKPLLTVQQYNELRETPRGKQVMNTIKSSGYDESVYRVEFEAFYLESILAPILFD